MILKLVSLLIVLYAQSTMSMDIPTNANEQKKYLRTKRRSLHHSNLHQSNHHHSKPMECILLRRFVLFTNPGANHNGDPEDYVWDCEFDLPNGQTKTYHLLFGDDNSNRGWLEKRENEIISASTVLVAQGILDEETLHFAVSNPIELKQNTDHRNLELTLSSFTGTRSLLIVRVEALDSSTTATEDELRNAVFDDENAVTATSQMKDCSYGQLQFTKSQSYEDHTFNDGVITIQINATVSGITATQMSQTKQVVVNALEAKYNTSDLADFVALCLPKDPLREGEPNAAGVANGGKHVAWYYDDKCLIPTVLMHEMAHQVKLWHSQATVGAYADQTGVLGHWWKDNAKRCYNAVKNVFLGWYDDKVVRFNPLTESTWSGQICGLSDYNTSCTTMIIEIDGHGTDNNYGGLNHYISFNRAAGINSDTLTYKDQVLIHRWQKIGDSYSYLDAALAAGDGYTIDDLGITIVVNEININSDPGYADVTITSAFSLPEPTLSARPTSLPSTTAPSSFPSNLPTGSTLLESTKTGPEVLFQDDFSSFDSTKWTEYDGQYDSSVRNPIIKNGARIRLKGSGSYCSWIVSDEIDATEYNRIELKTKYRTRYLDAGEVLRVQWKKATPDSKWSEPLDEYAATSWVDKNIDLADAGNTKINIRFELVADQAKERGEIDFVEVVGYN